jgi:L-aspartate oxidase
MTVLTERVEKKAIVVGAGSAGATFALELADAGIRVDLYTKEGTPFRDPEASSSVLLAGGYAAVPLENGVPAAGDSIEKHVQDTLTAGGGLNSLSVVRHFVQSFPEVIAWLEERGIRFDHDLHSEGSHSASRVFHVSDQTGQTVMGRLGELVMTHPNISVFPGHIAIDLITQMDEDNSRGTCVGLYVLDIHTHEVKTVVGNAIALATGGLGKTFLYTTNPDTASGDGFGMCYRAGLPLVNMEFVQFHPTVSYKPKAEHELERRVLFTEALRGAGAILKLSPVDTEDFVLTYDPRGSKASRDVVSRAEDAEMKRLGLNHVWLDCTRIDPEHLRTGFQAFYSYCMANGLDPTKESVPVVYAAHYSNGGVLVGLSGETVYPDGSGIEDLYVIGETAFTGLHGATRLASNSGPEAIAMSLNAAAHFLKYNRGLARRTEVPMWTPGKATTSQERHKVEYFWTGIRQTMTEQCGIARDGARLRVALRQLEEYGAELNRYYWDYFVERDTLEDRNILDVSMLILQSALFRKETRACHFRTDHPETLDMYKGWTLVKKGYPPSLLPIPD